MTAVEREDGVALVIAMIAVLLMSALGAALILTSSSETIVAGHFRDNLEARYAAGAMIERGMDDVSAVADWSPLIDGLQRSSWIDGPPAGPRTLPDGSTLDLLQALNLANCQKSAACSQADLALVAADRPWGANNPRWALYAYGPLRNLLPSPVIQSACYVLLLVGNGPALGLLAMRAEAFGQRGAHAIVEVTLGRASRLGDGTDYNDDRGQGAVKILSWREVR